MPSRQVGAHRGRQDDASVTRLAPFRLGTETATLSNWGSGVVMVLVPTALEVVRGVSVLEAGIIFLGFSAPFALTKLSRVEAEEPAYLWPEV